MNAILLLSLALFLLKFFDFSLALYHPLYKICGSTNYTANSTYESNLKIMFSSLYTEAIMGYSKTSTGDGPNQTSGLFLCRGDVNLSVCSSCLNQSFKDAPSLCPYKREAIIYYDYCLLSYSNVDFLHFTDQLSQYSEVYMLNTQNTTVAYNSTSRFGTGEIKMDDPASTIFGLTQCVTDLLSNDCLECLQELIDNMLLWFDGRQGGRILSVRCNLRYEVYAFFNGHPALSISAPKISPPPPMMAPLTKGNKDEKGGISKQAIIAISITAAFFLCGCSVCFFWIKKRRYAAVKSFQNERMLEERSSDFSPYNFSQIADATYNFSSDNKLGQGGFGPVYKGVLPDGLELAVKRLSAQSDQGLVEFENEIQLIAKLQHRNLVRLIGWCIQREEKMLIYEYMPNKSLDFFIFDKMRRALINWGKRFDIIEGIAQGLLYLHKHSRLRIIHRDLKASNILLDSEMVPKISDFGLARIFGPKELEANTNRVVGTYGYMAPEYASQGLFSVKSDVFSFGVLVLEIVSGKRNTGIHQYGDYLNLLGYAWDRWKERKWFELIDPSIKEACQRQMERCIHVALLCVQDNPVDRVDMSEVISFLSTESIILPYPKQPAYFNIRIQETVKSSELNGSLCSINDATLTNLEGR
ncbi:hypothetical protein LUZ60_010798 [Juncus effusus]|nr:hypothetical protein LUZ60_010798 [Juncus effusus]